MCVCVCVCVCVIQVPSLALHMCQAMLSSTVANLSSVSIMNVEVVLRVFYLLGESIPEKVFLIIKLCVQVMYKSCSLMYNN